MGRERFSNIRQEFRKLDEHAEKERTADWASFRIDAGDYLAAGRSKFNLSFAENFPDAEASIREDFAKRHERGERVLVFDICGIADATSLGADKTACLSLKVPSKHDATKPNRIVFAGDIFKKDSLDPLLELSTEYGARPACIFFVPVGGLALNQASDAVQASILLKQFQRLYDALAPGGSMFLQVPEHLTVGTLNGQRVTAEERLRALVGESGKIGHKPGYPELFRITKNAE